MHGRVSEKPLSIGGKKMATISSEHKEQKRKRNLG